MSESSREVDGLHIAEWIRDERLNGPCEHWVRAGSDDPVLCSPCFRDRILGSPWLADLLARARAEGAAAIGGRIVDQLARDGFSDAADHIRGYIAVAERLDIDLARASLPQPTGTGDDTDGGGS